MCARGGEMENNSGLEIFIIFMNSPVVILSGRENGILEVFE